MNIYKYKKTIEQGETLKKAVNDFDIKKLISIGRFKDLLHHFE